MTAAPAPTPSAAVPLDEAAIARMDCRHGRMAFFAEDLWVGRALKLYGEWSEGEVDLFRQILRPGMRAIEAGANVGSHTLPIARMVGGLLAVEAQPAVHALLAENVAANGLGNVRTLNAAVGFGSGRLDLPRPDYAEAVNVGGVSAVAREQARTGAGPAVAVDTVEMVSIDQYDFRRVDFLKADVEGMEIPLLLGAQRTIERCRPLLYLEANMGPTREALVRLVKDLGYRVFDHVVAMAREDNFRGHAENVFAGLGSWNILAVPSEKDMRISGLAEL